MLPKPKNGEPRGLPSVFEQPSPQDLTLSIKYQQAKACKRGCKNTYECSEGLLCKHRNLPNK